MTRHHVLVVEDDTDIRDSLLDALDDQGVAAIGAVNGRDALNQLANATVLPCLILLDLMMPVMDGRAFRKAQLSDDRLASIPVVVISAFRDVTAGAAELAAAEVLKKPVKLNELLRITREHCPELGCV